MKKTLVIYYSFEGSTKKLAETISSELNADIMEIKPVNERQGKGFSKYFWGGSEVVMGKKPELLPHEKNIDDYDLIIVGSPIWAGNYSPPIKTILEGDYIRNKEVVYFYTHDGGPGKTESKAKAVIEKNNVYIGAKDFLNPSKKMESVLEEAKKWASSLISE